MQPTLIRQGDGMEKNSLKGMIQYFASRGMPEVVPAQVTKASPLTIRLKNETNTEIHEGSLMVPSGKLPLKAGEEVYLLAFNKNQGEMFFLLDRM